MASLKETLPPLLQTSRMVLQLFDYSSDHYSCLLASMNSPTAHRNMGDYGITTPGAFDQLNSGTRLSPGIFPRPMTVDVDVYYLLRLGSKNGPLMGGVSLAQRGTAVPPDMGWCVLEEYHGKGFATEAAKEVLRLVRDDLGIKEVMAWPGTRNLPSMNLAKRIGFVEGGSATDEKGEEHIAYILPGMAHRGNAQIAIYGEQAEHP